MGINGQCKAFIPAPAIADAEQAQPIDQRGPRSLIPAVQYKTKQPAGPGKITPPNRMAGVRGEPRVQNARHIWLFSQPVRNVKGAVLMLAQPQGQRAQAPQHQIAVIRTDKMAEHLRCKAQGGPACGIGRHRAHHHIAVPAQIFGSRCHNEINALFNACEEQGRCPGIVHHRFQAMRLRNSDKGRHILHLKGETPR